jgi:hypothetical protein
MIIELVLLICGMGAAVWFLPQLGFTMVHMSFFAIIVVFGFIVYALITHKG